MKEPTRVHDRHHFDTLIDARTPAEFAIDHIPNSVNYPVLDNEERRIVGTLYKQVGAFEARRVGGAMVAANLARHLQGPLADRPVGWKPLVYCWRGGLRSGSMTTWLRLVGWDAQQLAGGYKAWRRHVIDTLEHKAPQLPLVVICGATGTAKTRLLHALAAQGQQTLDLEGLARHKGSLLGELPDVPQPSQKAFETAILAALEGMDTARPVYIEGEGRRIGRLSVPITLVERMRSSPCIEVQAPVPVRVDYLLRDYAYLGERPTWLADQLAPLKPLHGKETIAAWQAMAHARQLPQLFEALATRHYDPSYASSNRSYFRAWERRSVVEADDLSPLGVEALAHKVASLGMAWMASEAAPVRPAASAP